ncbi:MAG: hypothetical protein RBS07_06065 [Lentimicrobium sp.]|jgi:hypothetical protein|nr:hypothetical protein [Lentimicrobium sp.]
MDKIATYKIFPDLRLHIEVFQGPLNIADLIELKNIEILDDSYNPNYNGIVSIEGVQINVKTKEDFAKYIESIKNDFRIIGNRRSAILTKTPGQVVAGVLYERAVKEFPMNFKIVSTIKAALEWINISYDFESLIFNNIELMKKVQPKNALKQ